MTLFKTLKHLALSLTLVTGLLPVHGALAADDSGLVPSQWVYSQSKVKTHFYKCTAEACNKTSLFSYHFQDVTGVSPAQFDSGMAAISANLKAHGFKYKLIGKSGKVQTVPASKYVVYSQKSAVTDPEGKTLQQISGLIVGNKLSISVDSTSDSMASADANFKKFASMLAGTLASYEQGLAKKKGKAACITGKMVPVCFGPN